jgi:hypothetical protein
VEVKEEWSLEAELGEGLAPHGCSRRAAPHTAHFKHYAHDKQAVSFYTCHCVASRGKQWHRVRDDNICRT